MSANYESGEIPPTSRMNKLIHRNAHFACAAALLNSRYTGMAATRPLISPEPFSGECSWTDWVDHFEAAATVNGWDDSTKLKWLPVHLTGKAQVAWRRLSTDAKGDYDTAKEALRKRFEPDSKRQRYAAEFHSRQSVTMRNGATSPTNFAVWQTRRSPPLRKTP